MARAWRSNLYAVNVAQILSNLDIASDELPSLKNLHGAPCILKIYKGGATLNVIPASKKADNRGMNCELRIPRCLTLKNSSDLLESTKNKKFACA